MKWVGKVYTIAKSTKIKSDQENLLLMNLKTGEFIIFDNINRTKLPRNLDDLIKLIMCNCGSNYDETVHFLYKNQYICDGNLDNNIVSLKYPYTVIVDNSNIKKIIDVIQNLSMGCNELINEIIIKKPDTNYLYCVEVILGSSKYLSILFDNYPSYQQYKRQINIKDTYFNKIYIVVNEHNWKEFLSECNYFTMFPSLTVIIDIFKLSVFSIKFITRTLFEYGISYSYDVYLSGVTIFDEDTISSLEDKLSCMYNQESAEFLHGFPVTKPSMMCPKKQISKVTDNIIIYNNENDSCQKCSQSCLCKKCIYGYICYLRGTKTTHKCHVKKILSKILEAN